MSQPLSPGSQSERGLKTLQRFASTGVMGKDALDNAQKDLFAEFTKRNFENEQSLRPPPSIPPRSHHITPPLRSPLKPRLLTLTQLCVMQSVCMLHGIGCTVQVCLPSDPPSRQRTLGCICFNLYTSLSKLVRLVCDATCTSASPRASPISVRTSGAWRHTPRTFAHGTLF